MFLSALLKNTARFTVQVEYTIYTSNLFLPKKGNKPFYFGFSSLILKFVSLLRSEMISAYVLNNLLPHLNDIGALPD